MTNRSFLDLPVEVIHCIFDNLDALTIIDSVHRVCKQLNLSAKSYDRLKLKSQPMKRCNFKTISHFIKPFVVIPLVIH